MIKRLLPHIRQYVRVRSVVAGADTLRASLIHLLDSSRLGVIHLDPEGHIALANHRALGVLRLGNGPFDENGFLRARLRCDNERLERLLAQPLPS